MRVIVDCDLTSRRPQKKIIAMTTTIPMLKTKKLDDQLNIAIEKPLKAELRSLKEKFGVDHNEWIRDLIRSNLPALKVKLGA